MRNYGHFCAGIMRGWCEKYTILNESCFYLLGISAWRQTKLWES